MQHALISVVVPAMNEADNLVSLYNEILNAFNSCDEQYDFEIIIVNDGSTDKTEEVIESLAQNDCRIKGIHFARNFGQQAALIAGLKEAAGDAIITIDADLEQPPEVMKQMLSMWRQGYQVVHSVRNDHPKTPLFKKWTSRLFYRIFSFLSQIPMEPGMLDFRLLDRQVADAALSMPEADFFLRGITTWIGFKQIRIPFNSNLRTKGKTKYSLKRMVSFAIRGITSFSTFPLRLATYLGAVMTLLSIGYGLYVSVKYFFWEHPTPGYASTILLISFLMGIQFLLIGLLGEYVARIHVEVKKRPRYFIARKTSNTAGNIPDSEQPVNLKDIKRKTNTT